MSVILGNLFSFASSGLFTNLSDNAVYPSVDEVASGVTYGPNGSDYTGTLGFDISGVDDLAILTEGMRVSPQSGGTAHDVTIEDRQVTIEDG